MEDGGKMRISDALRMTAENIEKIRVPVALGDEITRPLCAAVAMIRQCAEALEEKTAEAEEQEEDSDGQGDRIPV